MKQKKIKINDWSLEDIVGKTWIGENLEDIDEALVGIIPKMFYHYDIDEDSNRFIVVPVEYVDKVRDIVGEIIGMSALTTCLECDEIRDIIKKKENEKKWE